MVKVVVRLKALSLTDEIEGYFKYRYGSVEFHQRPEQKDYIVSFSVGGDITDELKNGIINTIQESMSLYQIECSDWKFSETDSV